MMAGNRTKVAGVKTRNGKPLWKSEEDYEPYSEKTGTFEYGDGYIVTPTIDPETGGPYKIDDLLEQYEKDGPYDLYTGEKLPVFEDIDTADSYAKWRSDNILNFDITDEEFFTGESGTYSKQDGSEITLADRKQDMIDYAAGARDSVYGFLGIPTDEDEGSGMSLGGLAVARKGIGTQEGEDMANKKFQMDDNKADLNDDGSLSSYEKARGEAVQKAMADDPEQDEKYAHGGMPCGMDEGLMVDPVSGNEIPIGSTAENVRDDIEIMISEGEYVLPADVVKWHGLKHIMDMEAEAKMGLMGMYGMGLIKYTDQETDGEVDEAEEATETPEGNEVEVASVEVSEEEPEVNETEDYQDSEYGTKTSSYGMVKKPKVAFIS
ncbi:hypothetical protein CRP235_gp41 [Roseobacter phage CRP-235]|nr:hypothetical protein CRP235_gp41 [Roseobacter phage CRP-235]